MTEPTPTSSPGTAETSSSPKSTERTSPRWRVPLAVAVVIAVLFLGWQLLDTRNELRALQTEVARRVGADDAVNRETRQIARNGQDGALALQGRVASLESRIVETEGQQAALDKLYQEFSRTRDERGLQEIEQAISIAAQQLQLAGNVPAALAALQSADSRLSAMDQARFLPLRRLLKRDIDKLNALPLTDINGMSLQIESMLGRIDSLPFAFERKPAAPAPAIKPASNTKDSKKTVVRGAASSKQASAPVAVDASAPVAEESAGLYSRLCALASEFMNGFRDLVRIERLDKPDAVLLAPMQASYLRENIRLRLLSARLALLQRDGRVVAEDSMQARLWLERYFDTSERSVASVIETLRSMETTGLVVSLPQLTETEAAMRRLRLER